MKRLLFIPIMVVSCSLDQGKLVGTWQAVALFESGQSVVTPLDPVRLTFYHTGDYTFNSVGFYEEKGRYRLAGNYLFLLDTTVQQPKERVLKVHFLSADSLKIGMEADGKKRTVFFEKRL